MSALRDAALQYIKIRQALGTKYLEQSVRLIEFIDFLEDRDKDVVVTAMALDWAMLPQQAQRATWARRLSIVRRFAQWFSAIDPRSEIPPRYLLSARQRRSKPHIFSDREVVEIMDEATRLASQQGLKAITYWTLFGLLATTGLRPGEALALDKSDVDLRSGILSIRQSKFGKSRFVPVQASTLAALTYYAERSNELCPRRQSDAFLISESGQRLQGCSTRRTFAKICQAVGLRPIVKASRIGRGPRMQDFRHTFATRRLLEWYRAGSNVQKEIPKLASYLGHSDVAHSYWYIEALPELLQLAANCVRANLPGGA